MRRRLRNGRSRNHSRSGAEKGLRIGRRGKRPTLSLAPRVSCNHIPPRLPQQTTGALESYNDEVTVSSYQNVIFSGSSPRGRVLGALDPPSSSGRCPASGRSSHTRSAATIAAVRSPRPRGKRRGGTSKSGAAGLPAATAWSSSGRKSLMFSVTIRRPRRRAGTAPGRSHRLALGLRPRRPRRGRHRAERRRCPRSSARRAGGGPSCQEPLLRLPRAEGLIGGSLVVGDLGVDLLRIGAVVGQCRPHPAHGQGQLRSDGLDCVAATQLGDRSSADPPSCSEDP